MKVFDKIKSLFKKEEPLSEEDQRIRITVQEVDNIFSNYKKEQPPLELEAKLITIFESIHMDIIKWYYMKSTEFTEKHDSASLQYLRKMVDFDFASIQRDTELPIKYEGISEDMRKVLRLAYASEDVHLPNQFTLLATYLCSIYGSQIMNLYIYRLTLSMINYYQIDEHLATFLTSEFPHVWIMLSVQTDILGIGPTEKPKLQ